MTIRDIEGGVQDLIKVDNIIVSVFDKTGLDGFVLGLVRVNPEIIFLSTGGTYVRIRDILGNPFLTNLVEVSEYTGSPEMEGGLVKTLHPKIHAGILGERNNPEHQRYLREELGGGVFIDMVVVNLYPFQQVASSSDVDFERARGHIDIGGPAMIRAAAKNFPGCAVVSDPMDYPGTLKHIIDNNGSTSFNQRFKFARKAFELTADYDRAVANYLKNQSLGGVRRSYKFTEG